MPRSQELEAIVLQTHNVGEADRFCILLTRERGKIPARARGVRKPKSRMGGSLLALQRISVTVHEGSAGFMITAASSTDNIQTTLAGFLQMQQVSEMLLSVLEDDHAIPEIFDLTVTFLDICKNNPSPRVLPFSIRLLHLLGVLPEDASHRIFAHMSDAERQYIRECTDGNWTTVKPIPPEDTKHLWLLCQRLIEDQSRRPMKTHLIVEAIVQK